ncbi:MAG: transposase [Planctomycetota bacterium]
MPRPARYSPADLCCHVINRGNGRATVFHKDADYASFLRILSLGCERHDMRLLAWCLMPNHFHFVAWPRGDGDLPRMMQWATTCHVRRYHRHYKTTGHVWQGRYKSFPIQGGGSLLSVLRYVERNPVRAGWFGRAQDWAVQRCSVAGKECAGVCPVSDGLQGSGTNCC